MYSYFYAHAIFDNSAGMGDEERRNCQQVPKDLDSHTIRINFPKCILVSGQAKQMQDLRQIFFFPNIFSKGLPNISNGESV